MAGADVSFRSQKRRGLFDQPYLLLTLTSLFWAGNTIVGRYVVGHIPPITLACIRSAGAFLILLPFAAPHLVRDWPAIRKHAGLMALLAFTGFSAYNMMAYYGLQYTTAINGLLLQSAGPLCVALWSFVLFGERLTARQAGGISISLTGVIVIVSQGSLAVLIGIGFNRGDAWLLIALVIYAYYMAALRNRPPMHPLSFLAVGMGLGSVADCAGDGVGAGKRQDFRCRQRQRREHRFRLRVSVVARLSLPQSRRRIDRRQPRRAVHLPCSGIWISDGGGVSRRALRALSRHRFCAGIRRHHGGDAEVVCSL
jgi:uncharacterized membrane protein